ncbi:hypothetical protein HDV00_001060 [Rhizophlyctis rosea]|nr:hypothetical protein HDV00_001060 [Rhizophlyctis rosea]
MRYLECAACLETLTEPYTLPCGYSVCKACFPPLGDDQAANPTSSPADDHHVPAHAHPDNHQPAKSEDQIAEQEQPHAGNPTTNSQTDSHASPSPTESQDDVAIPRYASLIQTYTCPARLCRRVHQYRFERLDVLVRDVLSAVSASGREQASRTSGRPGVDVAGARATSSAGENDAISESADVGQERTGSAPPENDIGRSRKRPKRDDDDTSSVYSFRSVPERELEGITSLTGITQDTFDCHLCLTTLYDPVTTACGHTWCRSCIITSLDHSRSCPLCRTQIPSRGYFIHRPSNRAITNILLTHFRDLYDARRRQTEEAYSQTLAAIPPQIASYLKSSQSSSTTSFRPTVTKIPVFVCSLVFPTSIQQFHIFEPRYRVLIRRAMQTNRRFGVCLPSPTPSGNGMDYLEYGTIVEVTQCEPVHGSEEMETSEGLLPRYFIECRGVVRFRVLGRNMTPEGYNEAWVERVEDVEPEDEAGIGAGGGGLGTVSSSSQPQSQTTSWIPRTSSPSPSQSPSTTFNPPSYPPPPSQQFDPTHLTHNLQIIETFLQTLYANVPRPAWHHLLSTHGLIPTDPADLTFWLAGIINKSPYEKWELLRMTSVVARVGVISAWVREIQMSAAARRPPVRRGSSESGYAVSGSGAGGGGGGGYGGGFLCGGWGFGVGVGGGVVGGVWGGGGVGRGDLLARKLGFAGHNEYETAILDSIAESTVDLHNAFIQYAVKAPVEQRPALRETFFSTILPTHLKFHGRFWEKNGNIGYYMGNKLTWPDLYLYVLIELLITKEGKDVVDPYPQLQKVVEVVRKEDRLRAYIDGEGRLGIFAPKKE